MLLQVELEVRRFWRGAIALAFATAAWAAYPSLVSPSASLGNSPPQNGQGFEYLAHQYLFTFMTDDDNTNNVASFHAMQSADVGQTWAELDAADRPFYPLSPGLTNFGFGRSYTVARDGSNALLLWTNAVYQNLGGNQLQYASFSISKVVFNLTTGLWGSISTTPVSFLNVYNISPASLQTANWTALYLLVRGPADYLLFVSGSLSGTSARCSYVTYDGTTFGSEVQLAGQTVAGTNYIPAGFVWDPVSGNVHFFMTHSGALLHVGMDSTGTFGTASTVVTPYLSSDQFRVSGFVSAPIVYTASGVKLAILTGVNSSGNDLIRVYVAPETLNPTFTASQITSDQSVAPQSVLSNLTVWTKIQSFSLVLSGGVLAASWVFWNGSIGFADSSVYSATAPLAPTLVWSTPAQLITVVPGVPNYIMDQVASFPVTGGIGVFGFAISEEFTSPNYVSQFSVIASGPSCPLNLLGAEIQAGCSNVW